MNMQFQGSQGQLLFNESRQTMSPAFSVGPCICFVVLFSVSHINAIDISITSWTSAEHWPVNFDLSERPFTQHRYQIKTAFWTFIYTTTRFWDSGNASWKWVSKCTFLETIPLAPEYVKMSCTFVLRVQSISIIQYIINNESIKINPANAGWIFFYTFVLLTIFSCFILAYLC